MPSLLHTPSRTDTIVAGVARLIARGGLAAVTTRAIAAETGISTASLAHHLTNRERLMSVVGHRTGRAHLSAAILRRVTERPLAFLPQTEEQVVATRVWLAWCELARSEPGVAFGVADSRPTNARCSTVASTNPWVRTTSTLRWRWCAASGRGLRGGDLDARRSGPGAPGGLARAPGHGIGDDA